MDQQLDNEGGETQQPVDNPNEAENNAKFELLQKEIIDKNLDKNSFVNYCLRKKENGDDLNVWTLEELKQLIQDFVNSKSAKTVDDKDKKDEAEIGKENVETIEKINVSLFLIFVDQLRR